MSTLLVISTMVFVLIKASMLGGTIPVSRSTTANRVVLGRISTNMSPLRDIIRDQVRINNKVGKKIHAMDKLLENINAMMDNFTVATQNQLSFNNMLETQIQQISAAIASQRNGGSSNTPIQESVRSIFTVFKEKALKSTEGSLGGVGSDKKPSTTENFSMKSSRHVKNATPATTSSPVTLAT
jgi:hypothetical protein